jgi:hypothetical protein
MCESLDVDVISEFLHLACTGDVEKARIIFEKKPEVINVFDEVIYIHYSFFFGKF